MNSYFVEPGTSTAVTNKTTFRSYPPTSPSVSTTSEKLHLVTTTQKVTLTVTDQTAGIEKHALKLYLTGLMATQYVYHKIFKPY